MEKKRAAGLSRRDMLRAFLAMPATLLLAACAAEEVSRATPPAPPTPVPSTPTQLPAPTDAPAPTATNTQVAQLLAPTPACGDDDDDPTPAQTEGPYYTPNTPERTSFLEAGMPGTKLVVSGLVLSTACQPVAQALLDFWHCDAAGVYDNEGYKLRGHQFTDDQGRYTLETILPGVYPGRTRHIHVKVQAPNQPILTTQMYFPNEPDNNRDRIFQPDLVMEVQDSATGKTAAFNFVLDLA